MIKRDVIIVTDGDLVARRTIETAASSLGLRTISASFGNPSKLNGKEIARLVRGAKSYPVVVMIDDKGYGGRGLGEKALDELIREPDMNVIGALAVASNSPYPDTAEVSASVSREGDVVNVGVDKLGYPHSKDGGTKVFGDTVGSLDDLNVPVIGIGDIGKMNGHDSRHRGAQITRKALEIVLRTNEDKQRQQ